jgi:hypothetical protein
LAVTVTTEGSGSCGYVFAEMWQMGELDRNFMLMHTSSGMLENIIGDCGHTKAGVKILSLH